MSPKVRLISIYLLTVELVVMCGIISGKPSSKMITVLPQKSKETANSTRTLM